MPTIQGEIEKAVQNVTGQAVRIHGAGRTDAGVHAAGQVATLSTESGLSPLRLAKAINFYLPSDIVIKDACAVDDNFDARRDALSREYRYTILNSPVRQPLYRRYSYLVSRKLNLEAMSKACQFLIGTHDFASFTNKEGGQKNTIRTISSAEMYRREDELLIFDISAKSFLPHQVRRTVGYLVKIGLGEMEIDSLQKLILSAEIGTAGPTAPAHGLCLQSVTYSDIGFGK